MQSFSNLIISAMWPIMLIGIAIILTTVIDLVVYLGYLHYLEANGYSQQEAKKKAYSTGKVATIFIISIIALIVLNFI